MNQQRSTASNPRKRRTGSDRSVASGALLALVVALTVGGAVLPAPAASQAQFSQVEVRGNQRIEAATVLSFAGIEPGQPVTAGQLNAAQQRILASGLFESVQVIPAQGRLVIEVTEFPTINRVSIEGNRRLNDEVLESLITSQPRRVYSPSTATADARAITDAYFQAGRLAASVEPRIIVRDQNRVDLVFEVTESAVVEVERIGFVGNRSFSDRRLRQALGTKQAGLFRQLIRRDTFIEDRVQFDRQVLTDFYRSRGFVDFEVLSVTPEFSRERDAFFLTFNMREGQRFTLGEVSVTSDVPGIDMPEFERAVRARTGQTYAPNRIDDTVARLERRAIELGLDFIRADPVITRNDRDLTLDVAFNLTRGPRILVERIDIEGNATTLDQVIRRQFRVVEGDPFNPREIRDSAERIRALGFFAQSDVTTREGTAPDRVIVDVNVEEQPTGSLTLGGSYSIDEGFGFAVGLSERNFLGRGQFLNVSLSGGIDNNNSSIRFVEPALLGRDVQGGLELYYRSTDSFNADFNTEQLGFSPSLGFPVSDNGRLNLTYRLSRDGISDVQRGDPLVPGDNGTSAIIQREEGRLITSAIGYNYSFNSQRAGLDPNTRYTFDFGQSFAGLGGDTQFIETTVSAGYETRVLNEDVGVSATFRGAALNFTDGNSRVIDRYRGRGFARGFTANGIGPRDLTATNEDALGGNYAAGIAFEADFPVGLPEEYGIRGGVFYDLGSIWGLDDTAGTGGEVDDSFRLRQVVGATLFWTTPIGPLRFDFTRALQKEDYDDERTFDFRVSTRF